MWTWILFGGVVLIVYYVYQMYKPKTPEEQLRGEMKKINKMLDGVFGSFEDLYECNSLEEMSHYADQVTSSSASDPEWNKDQLQQMDLSKVIDQMNPTFLGNIAYMCIHSPNEYNNQWKQYFRKIIQLNNLPVKFQIQ